jgi:hypothetical protein
MEIHDGYQAATFYRLGGGTPCGRWSERIAYPGDRRARGATVMGMVD